MKSPSFPTHPPSLELRPQNRHPETGRRLWLIPGPSHPSTSEKPLEFRCSPVARPRHNALRRARVWYLWWYPSRAKFPASSREQGLLWSHHCCCPPCAVIVPTGKDDRCLRRTQCLESSSGVHIKVRREKLDDLTRRNGQRRPAGDVDVADVAQETPKAQSSDNVGTTQTKALEKKGRSRLRIAND